jgi:O-antigen/teichoic acid export membrane protein
MSVRRNTAYNVAGAVIPLLATLITLPIYLRAIGEERYGVLIVLWTLLGYFGLFDLGLGRAITNRIAAFRERTALEREEVFWTALALNLALGSVGAVALWGAVGLVFQHFVDVPSGLAAEVWAALPWMVLGFPLLLTSSVMSGALMGREEFLAQNVVAVGTGVLIQVAPLVVALMLGPALPALVVAVVGVRIFSGLSLFGLCVRQLPIGLRPRLTRNHIRPLFGFGGWVTVTSIVGPLLTTLDRVIIGAVAGVRAVTYYSVPFNLASRISIIPGSLSSALFPRFSAVRGGEGDTLLDTAVGTLTVIITPLAVAVMLIMEPFLTWWVDADFAAAAAPVGEILAVGVWVNSLAYLPFTKLQGQGRPDLAAKFHLVEVLPYLGVLWLALSWKGAAGAAVAWSLRVGADASLMFWASGFRRWTTLLPGMAALAVAGVAVVATSGTAWHGLVIRGVIIVMIGVMAWRSAPPQLRASGDRLFRRIRQGGEVSA